MKKRFLAPFGFTLVELVVVITVLAILATVGFVSLQGYTVDARDGSRLTVLGSLERWLSMRYVTDNAYPMPDSPISVTASGYVVSYQGRAGAGVLSKAGMGVAKDPLDGIPYTYAVNADMTKYQLLGFLEGGKIQASAGFPVAYAAAPDYSKRYPHLRGHSLGILLKENLTPAHFDSATVDLVTATGTYVMQYDDVHSAAWTGSVLRGGIGGGDMVWYWNFDEPSGSVVRDASGNGSDGAFSGSFVPTRTIGRVGTALDFSSNSWVTSASWGYVDFWSLAGLKNSSTGTPHSIVGWIRSSRPLCEDTNNCRQWVLLLGTPGTWSHHWLIGWLHWPAQFWVWSGPQIKWFTYSPGVWQHVAMTFDGRKLTGYVDGVKIGSNGQGWWQSFNIADPRLYVGGGVQESPFDGKIDELRVYSRALEESEVANLYRSSK